MPGRKDQRQRELKGAAALCQKLDAFLPAAKQSRIESAPIPSLTLTLDKEDEIPNVTEIAPASTSTMTLDTEEEIRSVPTNSDARSTQLLQVDIGTIVEECKGDEEFISRILSMSISDKYAVLKNHVYSRENFEYPKTFIGGCNRCFKAEWLKQYNWLVYSIKLNGAFCLPCSLFNGSSGRIKAALVTKPFKTWQKKSEKFNEHEKKKYHQQSLEFADQLIRSVEHPETSLPAIINARRATNIAQNRCVLKSIARAILFCGKQCIALRGDAEQMDTPGNPGNFLALLKLLANTDDTLRNHLESPAMRCVTHMSPQTQNELIEVMGKHIILRQIVNEVKRAKYFAILADEVTAHNVEHLALCVRFVDDKGNIREEFLAFIALERITGRQIAASILQFLQENGIDAKNMRGQGYDGASNMSSNRVGVQALIRQVAPLASYIHCNSHCLNLVISNSCSLPAIRNITDQLQHCCRFFLHSPKRAGILQHIVKDNTPDSEKRKTLLNLCKTRWAERHSAYQHFYQAYCYIVEALEVVGHRQHLERYGNTYADWDTANRSEAQQILAAVTSFNFIVCFLTVYHYLSHLSGITIKLQRKTLDILEAHGMLHEVMAMYVKEREEVTKNFASIYVQCVRMAEQVGTVPEAPRVTKRQQHRTNPEASSVEEYYRRAVVIPFIDHIIQSLEDRFSPCSLIASSLLGIVPSVCCTREVCVDKAIHQYISDLPSPELFPAEMRRWKQRYIKMPCNIRPSSPAEAVKDCDADLFPNIHILLRIICTIPVTSCECERSASCLRRLNNYMRASMGKSRLSSLALLHIHYDHEVDLDEVVDCYARFHPRRLELDSLIRD